MYDLCMILWLATYLYSFTFITQVNFKTFLLVQDTTCPLAFRVHCLTSKQGQEPSTFSLINCPILDISCKWNYMMWRWYYFYLFFLTCSWHLSLETDHIFYLCPDIIRHRLSWRFILCLLQYTSLSW